MSKQSKAHNLIDLSLKASFLPHTAAFERATAKVKAAAKTLNEVKKAAKNDGFTVAQIKFAIQCSTPEGEAIAKSLIASNLLAAAYMDSDLGTQFTLFLEPDRTPITDRAYKEGQSAAMKNTAAVPKYDPSTEAYKFFMQGYHDEQGRQVKSGIGKLDAKAGNGKGASKAPKSGKKGAKAAPKAAKPAGKRGRPAGSGKKPPQDDVPPRKPAAAPATRASLAAAKKDAEAGGEDSYFSKSSDTAGNA
jgi:hypothetical protein